jgi:type IV pilus assembly protein PilY1
MKHSLKTEIATWLAASLVGLCILPIAAAFTPIQQPPASSAVPGNVVLALSVEFPTGLQTSYTSSSYTVTQKYEGYFDNRKCYLYISAEEVFRPVSAQNTNGTCPSASTEWSGNLLNWLTMANLDQFRSVMTGGTRDNFSTLSATYPGDTATKTILIHSFSDKNLYNVVKNLTVGTAGMPLTGANKVVRSGGYGSKFIVSNEAIFTNLSAEQQRAACAETPLPGVAGTSQCFNIRVEACIAVPVSAPTVGVESNCKNKYTGVAKPEGLIQDYADSLRFAALGYLNDDTNDRSGGVLRSAMKSVGPVAATATGVTPNVAKEWDASTGVMFSNPDTADALASGVTNSGLMNYLNKFGYAAGYKTYDPVGELYYAAQLYLRGVAPPTAYSKLPADAADAAKLKDGFPVIVDPKLKAGESRDPIINSCQKNFIIGLGDIATHCDGNLPGSTKAGCNGGTPTDPLGLNVQSLWDITRGYESLADNGWVNFTASGTPYMAGLAHWANTNDIRTDLSGTQTISTYLVDVQENMNRQSNVTEATLLKSQYWLAAKYGGFNTESVVGNNPNVDVTSWDKNGDGVPDTLFAGSTPTLLKSGLTAAFEGIKAKSGSNSASTPAVTSSRQTASSQIIYAEYDPKGWVGTVRSCSTSQSATKCLSEPTWEATKWFKTITPTAGLTPLTSTTRKIITSWKDGGFTKMPFQWANLNATQKSLLNSIDEKGEERLDFLRGSRVNEGTIFRKREDSLLGDIVNSGVTYVAGSGPAYSGTNFPGHAAFRATNKSRPPLVYVGANDGMLHAFDGLTGKEMFGYIPSSVFAKLPSLSAPNFQHQFFVDSTPMVADIQKDASTWRTMIVGGLGAGGRGYYALDITAQSTFATSDETLLSQLPMWEFTSVQDSDLGFTFNEPSVDPLSRAYKQIAKVADATTKSGEWRAIVGNGFGSSQGKAALYLLNANTGVAASKLVADAGGADNGLSSPTPMDTDQDGLVDTVYAGDLLGNMHKFQFSKSKESDFVLAPSGDVNGAWRYLGKLFSSGQPITTAPSVVPSCAGNGYTVAFGTGKLNEAGDYRDASTRGFYAVADSNPSSASLTVANSDLVNIPYVTSATANFTTRNWSTPNLTGKRGWRMAFTGGERILSNSTLPPDTGSVLFSTTKPSGDVCTPGNTGFLMSVNLCSGKVGKILVDGNTYGGVDLLCTGVCKPGPTYTTGSQIEVPVNQPSKSPLKLVKSVAPKGRYSWREILTK